MEISSTSSSSSTSDASALGTQRRWRQLRVLRRQVASGAHESSPWATVKRQPATAPRKPAGRGRRVGRRLTSVRPRRSSAPVRSLSAHASRRPVDECRRRCGRGAGALSVHTVHRRPTIRLHRIEPCALGLAYISMLAMRVCARPPRPASIGASGVLSCDRCSVGGRTRHVNGSTRPRRCAAPPGFVVFRTVLMVLPIQVLANALVQRGSTKRRDRIPARDKPMPSEHQLLDDLADSPRPITSIATT